MLVRKHSFSTMEVKKYMKSMNLSLMRKKGTGAATDDGPNEYNVFRSFTDYFTPKKNTSYELLKFRYINQNKGETIDSFHTRLRALATNCDFQFHDTDSEIFTQILHGCTSSRLRRRALGNHLP